MREDFEKEAALNEVLQAKRAKVEKVNVKPAQPAAYVDVFAFRRGRNYLKRRI